MQELEVESLPLSIDPAWGIVEVQSETKAAGYRFFPDQVKGEGFFLACFRKTGSTPNTVRPPKKQNGKNCPKPKQPSFNLG